MKSQSIRKLLCGFAAVSMGILATGCGKNIVTDAGVTSNVQNGDQYADVYAVLDMGQISLPTITLPIFNPLNPGPTYGQLSLSPTSDGKAEIEIGVDLTVVAKLPGGSPTLPNGTTLPISDVTQAKVLSIPIPNTKFVVYIALQVDVLHPGSSPVAMVGVALPFPQFDSMGASVGNTDLFASFNLPKGIQGTAGIFAGRQAGTSGIGLFVDVSGLIQSVSPPAPHSLLAMLSLRPAVPAISAPTGAPLRYQDRSPGGSTERRIKKTLYRMHQDRTQLTID